MLAPYCAASPGIDYCKPLLRDRPGSHPESAVEKTRITIATYSTATGRVVTARPLVIRNQYKPADS